MLKIERRHISKCKRDKPCRCPLRLMGTVNGKRVRKGLGTASMEVARKAALALELDLLTGKSSTKRITMTDAIASHRRDIGRRNLSRSVQRKYERLHGELDRALGRRFVDEIEPEDLRGIMASWTQAPRTQRNQLIQLRSLFTFCVDSGWIDRSPAKRLKSPAVAPSHPQPYTKEECTAILSAVDKYGKTGSARARMRALLILLRFTGLSLGDAVRLPKAAIRGNQIITSRKKTGEQVHVLLPTSIMQVVMDALSSFPHVSTTYYFWTGIGDPDSITRTYRRRLREVFDLSGVPGADSRRFRQTVASELAAFGIEHAQVALAHSSVKTTEKHYASWTRERQQGFEAAAALAFGDDARALAGTFGTSLTHGENHRAN